jgi:hypothetical protein
VIQKIAPARCLDDLAIGHENHAIDDLAGKAHFVGDVPLNVPAARIAGRPWSTAR